MWLQPKKIKYKRLVSTSTAFYIGSKPPKDPYLMALVFVCAIVTKVVIRKFDLTHLYLGDSAALYCYISNMTTDFGPLSFYDPERGGYWTPWNVRFNDFFAIGHGGRILWLCQDTTALSNFAVSDALARGLTVPNSEVGHHESLLLCIFKAQLFLVAKCFKFVKLAVDQNRSFHISDISTNEEARDLVMNWRAFSSEVYDYIFRVLLQNRIEGWEEMDPDQLMSEFITLHDSGGLAGLGFDETFNWNLVEQILVFSATFSRFRDHISFRILFSMCRGLVEGHEGLYSAIERVVDITTREGVFEYPND